MFFCSAVLAQNRPDIRVTASVNSTIVYEGEQFVVNVEVSGSALQSVPRPATPELEGLIYVSRSPSTSSSISIVNGVRSSTFGFRYFLRGDRVGRYTIPAFTLLIEGITYRTDPIQIEVIRRDQPDRRRNEQPDIFLQLELSNENPWVGQQVTANVVLYFRGDMDILSFQPLSSWRTEGFWLQNLNEDGVNPRAETVMLNGVRYRKATLSSFALFPTRAGTLNIGEYAIRANVRITGRMDDMAQRFFSGFGRTQQSVDLNTEAVELSVRRLPQPQPEGFTGAVGRFEISRRLVPNDVTIGEPLELVTTIEGRGNIPLINAPTFEVTEAFERFQPQEMTNINRVGDLIAGNKTFTDVLIGRQAGAKEIPAGVFSWFDPQTGRYVTRSLASIPVTIRRDLSQVSGRVEESRLNLRPVIGVTVWRQQQDISPYKAWWFWFLAALPLIIFAIAWQRNRYLERMRTDATFSRYQLAEEVAQKTIESSFEKSEVGNWRGAYGDLHRALSVFISDRTGLPPTGHSDATLGSALKEKGIDATFADNITKTLTKYSTIQYAPENVRDSFERNVEETRDFIKKIGRLT